MTSFAARLVHSAISYVPSPSLMAARRLRGLPSRLARRPHEADFEVLRALGGSGLVVLDVGANRGQTIDSMRFVLDDPQLHAVEPNPMLAGSLSDRYPKVVVHNVALADGPGSMTLYVPRYGHTYWDTRASLDPEVAAAFLGPEWFLGYRPERGSVEPLEVDVTTLDSLGLAPDILKIDAEGAEALILRGAVKTLEQEPILMLEGRDAAVSEIIEPLGYRPHHAVDGKLIAGDTGLNTFHLLPAHHRRFAAVMD